MTDSVRYILGVALLSFVIPSVADHHGSVRIYKLNSKNQLVKNRWVKREHKPGCHDLRGSRKAHRFAQTGFTWCTVYSGDSCKPGTELSAMWRGNKYRTADIDVSQPQLRLLPGSDWYFDPARNIEMGSWTCEY